MNITDPNHFNNYTAPLWVKLKVFREGTFNMVFHPNFVDNHLVMHKIFQFKIMKINDGIPAFSIA